MTQQLKDRWDGILLDGVTAYRGGDRLYFSTESVKQALIDALIEEVEKKKIDVLEPYTDPYDNPDARDGNNAAIDDVLSILTELRGGDNE